MAKHNTAANINAIWYLIYSIDVNGPLVTLKVTVILNKRRYQSINQ